MVSASGPVQTVLSRLQGVREHAEGGKWEARCPAHDDRRQSLGVSVGRDGKVLLFCQANCAVADVVRALGLELRDLWPKEESTNGHHAAGNGQGRPIVAAYEYQDEAGCTLYRVVRMEPKDFRQQAPDGKGGWKWGLGGRQPVLYRYPELLQAPLEEPVFVAEGEKDVDAVRALGLVATCNPMGAGKWRAHYNLPFKGRRVFILPDNDEPGRAHADLVLKNLTGVAKSVASVLLPGLPVKGDVSDWLASGGTREQLLAFIVAADQPEPSEWPVPVPASRLRRGDPSRAWLLEGYLGRGEITLLSSIWKAGKTTLLAHLFRTMAAPGMFCGQANLAARILMVTEESETRWAQRRDEVGLGDHMEFLIRPFSGRPSMDRWEQFLGHLKTLLVANPYDLVVFDTMANLWPVKDENDAAAVQTALMPLHGLIGGREGQDGPCLLLVHHARKSDGQEGTASRGSGAFPAFVDTIVELRRFNPTDRKCRKRVLTGYGRHDETPDELVVELTDAGFVSAGGDRSAVRAGSVLRVLMDLLPGICPGMTYEQVRANWPDETAPSRSTILAALDAGCRQGDLQQDGEGKRGDPFTYWRRPFPD